MLKDLLGLKPGRLFDVKELILLKFLTLFSMNIEHFLIAELPFILIFIVLFGG